MKKKIEDPTFLKSYELLNRIVMPPMERARAHKNGDTPTAIMETYYTQRAGAGLIISEPIYISENSRINGDTSYIKKKAQINSWKKINEAVEDALGVIFACLSHGGGYAHSKVNKGKKPVSPSGVINNKRQLNFFEGNFLERDHPEEICIDGIKNVLLDFEVAAQNTFDAKFNGILIDFSAPSLMSEFLDPESNKRTDEYGYSENHSLFAENLINIACNAIGRDSVAIRIQPKQIGILKSIIIDSGIAMLQINGKITDKKLVSDIKEQLPDLVWCFESNFDGVLFDSLLNNGTFDLFAIKDSFIANPDLAARIRKGLPIAQHDDSFILEGREKGYIDFPNFSLRAR